MTQTHALTWISPQVTVTRQSEDLLLENVVGLAPYPDNIAVWLRSNAERFPNKPFVLQRNLAGSWQGPTYAEALARVNRLSNGLLAQGLDGSRPIAILSENSVEMALLQLAAMQVGLAVAPISYAYSALSQSGGHIKHILDMTRAPLIMMSDANVHMPKLRQWDISGIQLYALSNYAEQ